MELIVQCPKCSARLKLPPSSKGGVCPHCHTPVMAASTPGAPPVQPKPPVAVSTAGSKPPILVRPSSAAVSQSVKNLGFIAYLRRHFAATHWPEAFGICLGLLAIPIVSLLKPVLGFRGMCFVLAGIVAFSVLSGFVYMIQRVTGYFFRGERIVAIRPRSWTARLTYGGWMFLIPMSLWVGAEYFSPPYGLLAALAPDLRKEQSRWLRLPVADTVSGDEKGQPPQDMTGKGKSAQTQTESENPFEVVEDVPATKTTPKDKAPPTPNKSDDGDPFQVIKD